MIKRYNKKKGKMPMEGFSLIKCLSYCMMKAKKKKLSINREKRQDEYIMECEGI